MNTEEITHKVVINRDVEIVEEDYVGMVFSVKLTDTQILNHLNSWYFTTPLTIHEFRDQYVVLGAKLY